MCDLFLRDGLLFLKATCLSEGGSAGLILLNNSKLEKIASPLYKERGKAILFKIFVQTRITV